MSNRWVYIFNLDFCRVLNSCTVKVQLSRVPTWVTKGQTRVLIALFPWYFSAWSINTFTTISCFCTHAFCTHVNDIAGRSWPCFSVSQTTSAFFPKHSCNLIRVSIGLKDWSLVVYCDLEQLLLYTSVFSSVKRLREVAIKYHKQNTLFSNFLGKFHPLYTP